MKVIKVRNVHEALPRAIDLLYAYGIKRDSRNGPVLQYPTPVTTVYENPCERVLFWPERNANPFFHLFESLWMLAGHQDVEPLLQYAKNMKDFSDNGKIFHGAYGYRWRKHFRMVLPEQGSFVTTFDQLQIIAKALTANQEDRRCVLQMWNPEIDLGKQGKDFPCNIEATFQRDAIGALHLVVFCRSNDIIWGAYGANAVHFSFLLEYMAAWIGCPVGTYTQISVNWHGYLTTLTPMVKLRDYTSLQTNPYATLQGEHLGIRKPIVKHYPLPQNVKAIDNFIKETMVEVYYQREFPVKYFEVPIFNIIYQILAAHRLFKIKGPQAAIDCLDMCNFPDADWVVAGLQWMVRRATNQEQK